MAGLFVCVALLDLPVLLPPWAHIGLLVGTGLLIVGLLIRGLHGIAAPDDVAADRRLEVASGLSHRPLAVLTDRPARGSKGPDAASVALWQVHVARAVRQVRRLRVGLPRPGLARRDPRALRAALVLALVATFAIAGDDAPGTAGAGDGADTAARDTRRRHRATGLDHAACLHAAWRRSS